MDEILAVRRHSHGGSCHSSPAEAVAGSTAWIGRGLSCVCAQRRESDARLSFDLTPSQEECLQRLQNRIDVTYDSTKIEHQVIFGFCEENYGTTISYYEKKILRICNHLKTGNGQGPLYYCGKTSLPWEALRALWCAAYPEVELSGLISEQWKEMGWQGKDPSTDFRGGGFISLENLLFFARTYPNSFQDLLRKEVGNRSAWEYPFAVAGVNITFMLIQMLDLQIVKPRTMMGAVFLKLLSENERAFDVLYCITFKLMDHLWLEMHASYMEFNTVMKATRRQLERELLLEDIQRLEDMPSYKLLTW